MIEFFFTFYIRFFLFAFPQAVKEPLIVRFAHGYTLVGLFLQTHIYTIYQLF